MIQQPVGDDVDDTVMKITFCFDLAPASYLQVEKKKKKKNARKQ